MIDAWTGTVSLIETAENILQKGWQVGGGLGVNQASEGEQAPELWNNTACSRYCELWRLGRLGDGGGGAGEDETT